MTKKKSKQKEAPEKSRKERPAEKEERTFDAKTKVIRTIQINEKNAILVSNVEYKDGNVMLDIRRWYVDKSDDLKPTGKGLSVPYDNLDALIKALKRAKKRHEDATSESE